MGQKAHWKDVRPAWRVEQVKRWRLRIDHDQAGQVGTPDREGGSEVAAQSAADQNQVAGADVAHAGEVVERGLYVLNPTVLRWPEPLTLAEGARIEGEYVVAEGVQRREIGESVGERTTRLVQIENRGGLVRKFGVRGDPPAIEPCLPGFCSVEADILKGDTAAAGVLATT